MLVDTIDKELFKTIKSVVLRDMKHEIQALRNDEKGCTDKCRLKGHLSELDLERHRAVVKCLIEFKWCSVCMSIEPGAVRVVCQSGCGKQLMSRCVPLMTQFSL